MKKIMISLLFLGMCLMVVPVSAATQVTRANSIAHRGAIDLAPEGTIASFEAAKNAGYGKFECDVWYTESGEFMICHDKTIKRLTGLNLPSYKLSTKNRKRYPIIHGPNIKEYKTQYFATIQEVLQFSEDNNMKPFFHLKVNENSTFTKKALRKLNKIVSKYKGEREPVFFSSNKNVVKRMKKYHWQKGYITSASSGYRLRQAFRFAKKNCCKFAIHPFRGGTSKADIRCAHKKGLKTACYEIDSQKSANEALRLGEDYVITNRTVF